MPALREVFQQRGIEGLCDAIDEMFAALKPEAKRDELVIAQPLPVVAEEEVKNG